MCVCVCVCVWWDSFAAESKSSKLAVTEWLQKHQTTPIIDRVYIYIYNSLLICC
jgi:hypothetical protein